MNAETYRRRCWLILSLVWLIANALDVATTIIAAQRLGPWMVEMNPLVQYFGWGIASLFKLGVTLAYPVIFLALWGYTARMLFAASCLIMLGVATWNGAQLLALL